MIGSSSNRDALIVRLLLDDGLDPNLEAFQGLRSLHLIYLNYTESAST